ncbi:MAG: multiprotein bridging factor aMBF1 [Candidatus Saliniplasma sp.]
MNCELCGKKVGKPKKVKVEGSVLQVCEQCASYGKEVLQKKKGGTEERLNRVERKKRSRRSSAGFGNENKTLVMDFPDKIRKARLENDWTQEELAKNLNEKKSVVAKLERADMRPSDSLREKLEKTLNIILLEEIEQVSTTSQRNETGLTIGDLIKEE